MQSVTILCIGKLKETYLTDGCAEYLKRLGAYCKARVVELPESRLPDQPSPRQIQQALEEEGKELLAKIPAGAWVAALCIEGRQVSSPGLAGLIEEAGLQGRSSLVFVIGGSWGLSDEVKRRAQLRLSLSEMTFPHQLARMLLLEQLYRAYSILHHGKYHK